MIIFVALCTVLGLVALKKVGGKAENYFVAGRSLSLPVLAATLAGQVPRALHMASVHPRPRTHADLTPTRRHPSFPHSRSLRTFARCPLAQGIDGSGTMGSALGRRA